MSMNDGGHLLKAFLEGEENSFPEFLKIYSGAIYTFLLQSGLSRSDADVMCFKRSRFQSLEAHIRSIVRVEFRHGFLL